ncbi:hypothetical protein BH23ACT5_BH23ACT5_23590 [soil metagenome]
MRHITCLVLLLVAACGSSPETPATEPAATEPLADQTQSAQGCAHVIEATIEPDGDGRFTVSATVSSADQGEEKYADRWEVRSADGEVLATRVLTHPHVDEQPFTRSLPGVEIPTGAGEVTIAARDNVEGFCGDVLTLDLPAG